MKLKKIKPMYTRILTTMDMYTDKEASSLGGIIDPTKLKKGVNAVQKVLAVGSSVRNVKEGDLVSIDPKRYEVRQYSPESIKSDMLTNQVVRYTFPVHVIDGKECMLLDESDVEYIIEEFEDDSEVVS